MKFSHQIKFNSVADWKDHYIHYANLKVSLQHYKLPMGAAPTRNVLFSFRNLFTKLHAWNKHPSSPMRRTGRPAFMSRYCVMLQHGHWT